MLSIYNELHNVHVISGLGEKESVLRIVIELVNTTSNEKVLNLKIIDDEDTSFLYILLLREEDFSLLKSQQGLRVDFDHFPKQLVKLLNDCKNLDHNNSFRILLENGDPEDGIRGRSGCYFKIVQSNEFKHLCHLSLRIGPGSHDDIRKELDLKLKALQCKFTLLSAEHECLKIDHEENLKCLNTVEEKLKTLELKATEEIGSIKLDLNQRLALEKEKWGNERMEMEKRQKEATKTLNDEIALLTHRNEILSQAKRDLESNLSILKVKNENADKEIERIATSNSELQQNNDNLMEKVASLENSLTTTQRKLSVADARRQEMTVALSQLRRDLESTKERETAAVQSLAQCEQRLRYKISQLSIASEEISKLKGEIDAKRNKVSKMVEVIERLEQSKEVLLKDLETNKEAVDELKEQEGRLKAENDETEKRNGVLEKRVKELEAAVQRHIDVNSCLHRKLSEQHNASAPDVGCPRPNTSLSSRTLPARFTSSILEKHITFRSEADQDGSCKSKGLDPSYLMQVLPDAGKSRKPTSAYFTARS